jgi:hypothetical protein
MANMGLRLFDVLYEALKTSAAKNQRSLHGEIIYALIEYVRGQGYEINDDDLQKPKPGRSQKANEPKERRNAQ